MLRCITWLSPGLPLGLFECITGELGRVLDVEVSLESRTESSGPDPVDDPFARDEADIGFLCAPSFRRLTSVTAIAAPVFTDPRAEHAPVYFSELVVRDGIDADSIEDLAGRCVGFNDHASLSGYTALVAELARRSMDGDVELVHTGGHRASLQALAEGSIDAAAIDSNTLLGLGALPDGLRVVETWGPFPVQPVVARSSLPDERRAEMSHALVSMAADEARAAELARFGVERFVAVTRDHYDVVN